MIAGAILVAISLLVLGWTKEIVDVFIKDKDTAKTCTITLAVLSIYAVDFAINAGKPYCHEKLRYFDIERALTYVQSNLALAA